MSIEIKSEARHHRPSKLLIAEDEPALLQVYKLFLAHHGHQIVATNNGEDSLEAYRAELSKVGANTPPFDIVLLDYRMPKKNGAEIAREILSLCPSQKLIMITAYGGISGLDEDILKKVILMPKPFEFERLFATIAAELKNA
jgi:two-component system cell cycle response regulator CpdR